MVKKRDTAHLIPLIKQWIRPGTMIYSDMWKAYQAIPRCEGYNFGYKTVNHSVEFVTSEGIHTNCIEGFWAILKAKIPGRHYEDVAALQEHLFTQMFFNHTKNCRWVGFWAELRRIRLAHNKKAYIYLQH